MRDLFASADDLLSSDRAVRTSELKRLERNVIPQLDEGAALDLLQGANGEGVGKVLLAIVGDKDAPEICREKAAIVLRGCLQRAYGCSFTSDAGPSEAADESHLTQYLGKFYVAFCTTLQSRISPPQSPGSALPTGGSVEPSEEIRLVLVNIASDLLTYMDSSSLCIDDATQSTSVLHASSILCRAIAEKGLSDPYAELKRECCIVLAKLTRTFPRVVRMHAEALLQPITGGAAAYDTFAGGSSGLSLDPSKGNGATRSSLNASLMRHRHAKTRSLAIEASADILSCCPTGAGDNSSKGSRGGTLQDILQSHVFSCWEDTPLFDRSASVRIALIKAVGKVSRLMAADFAVNAEIPANPERCTLPLAPRLIILLLSGMSEDSTSVCSVASDEFLMLGREFAAVTAVLEENNCDDDVLRSRLLTVQSSNILTILLHDMSRIWANERKVKALSALEVFIRLMGDARDDREQSATCCLVSETAELVAMLFQCFGEDDDATLNAASLCARALGADCSLVSPALGVLLPSLHGPVEKHASLSASDDSNDATKSRILLSEPPHFASALSLLGCLLEGCTHRLNNTPETADARLWGARECDISAALSNVSVLDAASSTLATAWALLDACKALCDSIPDAYFDEKGNMLKTAAVAVNILTCTMHLLGCPHSFGLQIQTLELLDYIANKHNGIETRAEMMRLYFRGVLRCITSESSRADEEAIEACSWEADDRRLRAFDALLRFSGGCAVGENFDLVTPVFEANLAASASTEKDTSGEPQIDYAAKLSIMALLESTVSDPTFPDEFVQPFTAKLLNSVVMPNLVWHVGGMAAALRKVSAATLFSLLRGGSATAESLFLSAPRLLPVLRSNLSDDDASTRELICSSLGIIFEVIPAALGEEAVSQLCPDLAKCLDDSSDSVRFASCRSLKYFLKAAPPSHFKGPPIDLIVDQLLIHMDDPDRDFQKAAMEVLTVALIVDQNVVVTKTMAARSCHRSDEFCNLLLRRAEERTAASKLMSS